MPSTVMLITMRIAFMFWLLLGEGIFCLTCKRRKNFKLRITLSVFGSLAVSTLIGFICERLMTVCSTMPQAKILYAIINVMGHILIFVVSLAAIHITFNENRRTIFFCAIAGYCFANIGLTVSDTIAYIFPDLKFMSLNPITGWDVVYYVFSYLIIYLILALIFARQRIPLSDVANMNPEATYFMSVAEILIAMVVKSFASVFSSSFDWIQLLLENIPIVMCSLLVLSIQFYLTNEYINKKENDAIVHETYLKLEQYKLTKETIDIINIKCHDLKHQLRELKGRKEEIDDEFLSQLEESISIYDSTIQTGNEALDTLLTEKNLLCKKDNIQLTAIADGSCLSFLSKADLFSLFGNALDNAIEYTKKLESDNRIIKMSVKKNMNCVAIKISNYFQEDRLELVNGLPKTSKNEKHYHGFGLKSIKYIVNKYQGDFSLSTENHEFTINILFVGKDN